MRTLRLQNEVELFVAGVGAAQSLFLSIYSLLERKWDFRNLLLSLFFFAITIRLTKSILWVYLDTSPIWFINLGFAAHALTGPALLLYVWHFLFQKKWSHWNWIHFVPGILLLLFINLLTRDGFWYIGGYTALLFHQMSYVLGGLVLLGIFLRKKSLRVQPTKAAKIWLTILILGTATLQFLYFSNYILGITPYLLGPLLYLPFIYFLAFVLFKNPKILQHVTAQKNGAANLSAEELSALAERLQKTMESEKLYLDPDCTMAKVAKATNMQPYLVSHVVNKVIGMGFPDFLNSYRVEAVKNRLVHPNYRHTKIASIAYDCGFNTLSAFNTAFKKATGFTPTKFQKEQVSS
ncbi:helix-turn-helix domain-containing protein [Flagellimonas sp.]|uniref:helix-turn-helix domain-containing protein n=1 Tax=Flagellimonas sp. TaxID=2058762 RepID=UPI003B519FB3